MIAKILKEKILSKIFFVKVSLILNQLVIQKMRNLRRIFGIYFVSPFVIVQATKSVILVASKAFGYNFSLKLLRIVGTAYSVNRVLKFRRIVWQLLQFNEPMQQPLDHDEDVDGSVASKHYMFWGQSSA